VTRVFETQDGAPGVRLLVLGASHYPNAQVAAGKIPKLANIDSAARSAVMFATKALEVWSGLLPRPVVSLDLLVNTPDHPDGVDFQVPGGALVPVQAPTMANIKAAKKRWADDAGPHDILIFYCCGHGLWQPSMRTFLASDFGVDPVEAWPFAIALDQMAEGVADLAPRQQWMIFDCCANSPPQALRNSNPAAAPLFEVTEGMRKQMADAHGPLVQAKIAAAPNGAQAYGRQGGLSRFMDMFVEACEGSGFSTLGDDDDRWHLTLAGLEAAMASYADRIAASQDRDYYSFSRYITSDASQSPRLMARDQPPPCVLLVTSDPAFRLTQCALDVYHDADHIVGQAPGVTAKARFRHPVAPFRPYRVTAVWPGDPPQERQKLAVPPLAAFKF
jgi:Caspase domain